MTANALIVRKPTFIQRIRSAWAQFVNSAPKLAKRFKAAKISRLTADWLTRSNSANRKLREDLAALRSRARIMADDDSRFKRFLRMARRNTVGPKGIQLQCRARNSKGALNRRLNKMVEEAFWKWSFPESCTVSGKLDWRAAQRLFVTQLIRDGEVLVRHRRTRPTADNPAGYSIQFIDAAYLDETYNQTGRDGNRIIMSVEIDDSDRPVAYWLTTPADNLLNVKGQARNRTRVPAEEMIHAFLVEDDEAQVRGVTWFAAVMNDARQFGGYMESVIVSSRVATMQMGFLKKDSPDVTEFDGIEDDEGNEQAVEIDIAPVTFNELPEGYSLQQFDPKQPNQNHAEFAKSIKQDIAAGLDVNYFSLAGDMESVNYSSARVGLNEERDLWQELQDFVGTFFCRPVFHAWLKEANLNGVLSLTPAQMDEVRNPIWRGRGWRYVDPQKEIAAQTEGLATGVLTLTDVLAERGVDIVDHFETLQSEQQLAADYGLTLDYTAGKGQAQPAAPPA